MGLSPTNLFSMIQDVASHFHFWTPFCNKCRETKFTVVRPEKRQCDTIRGQGDSLDSKIVMPTAKFYDSTEIKQSHSRGMNVSLRVRVEGWNLFKQFCDENRFETAGRGFEELLKLIK